MIDIINALMYNRNTEYLRCSNCHYFFNKWGGTHERLLKCSYCKTTISIRDFLKSRAPTNKDLKNMIDASKNSFENNF